MSVSIVNGFICITPGPEEVIKAQKGINPKPGLPSPRAIRRRVSTRSISRSTSGPDVRTLLASLATRAIKNPPSH
jgi:hypothetical protein